METKILQAEGVEAKRFNGTMAAAAARPQPGEVDRDIAAGIEEYRREIERIRELHGKTRRSILN